MDRPTLAHPPRVALVTGASRGIGAAIAAELAARGHRVAVGYRQDHLRAEQVVDQLRAAGATAHAVRLDYAARDSIRDALQQVRLLFGAEVEILVNNGAIAQEKPFLTITDDDFHQMVAVNLHGPWMAAQEVIPAMQRAGWGRIVNITSIGGQWGGVHQIHYAVAKAGLINFTRSLAKVFSRDGISTTAVAVGLVATEMTAAELASEAGQQKVRAIPIGRIGAPREVGAAVAYLCSEDAAYLTGQTLNLNGGMWFP